MKHLGKSLTIYAISLSMAFVFVGGLFLFVNSSEDMGLTPCQSMDGAATMCPMNLIQHIQMWDQATTTVPVEKFFLPLLTLAFLFSSLLSAVPKIAALAKFGRSIDPPDYNFFIRLKSLFSHGILHPKLYA